MKKHILGLSMVLVILLSLNQLTFSQGYCYPDQSPTYWKIDESLYGSKLLSGCSPSAYYNCHGFIMSYFETPCSEPRWIQPVSTPYLCPNSFGNKSSGDWQNSGKYVQVCSESDANVAYYQFIQGDHAAVKDIIPGGPIKYISKYNYDGPLVGHNLTGSWYHLTGQDIGIPIQYWAFAGSIDGNPNIVGTSAVTFDVNNIPNVNYFWSILSGYSNINITSSATQSSVTLSPTHSGTAVLQVSLSSSCGTVKTQQISLNITTNICLEGVYDNAGIYNQNLNTVNRVSVGGVAIRVTCPNSTTVVWQKTSGNINGYFPNGYSNSFNMTSKGTITLLLTAKNGSTTIGTRSITFYNY